MKASRRVDYVETKVWDVLVRIFHWSLVVSFFIAYFTDGKSLWHIYTGYGVLALIIFRVLWGFMGSKYARFSQFIYSPASTLDYVKTLADKKPKHYVGHNPVGGLMVVILLFSLFVVTLSGLKIYAIEEGKGPFSETNISIISNAYADNDDYRFRGDEYDEHDDKEDEAEEFWEEIHEVATNFTLFLILLHILGVGASSKIHNENLIKIMITGKKTLQQQKKK